MSKEGGFVDDYLRWFGLTRLPFGLVPDPDFLFLGPEHAEPLAALELGILERRGLVVLVGEVGTGKTTLLRTALESLDETVHTAYLSSTTLDFEDILALALEELGVEPPRRSKAELLKALRKFVEEADRQNRIVVLVIDEAQNLSDSCFEELRLLLNFETPKRKLLQIVLSGQPELHDKLALPALRHVADRVAVRCYLNPLTRAEAREYIAHRLRQAGGSEAIFEPSALRVIARASGGVPRRLNVLCHNALLFAFGRDSDRVDARIARTSIKERPRRSRWRLSPVGVALFFLGLTAAVAALLWLTAQGGLLGLSASGSSPPAERRPQPRAEVDAPDESRDRAGSSSLSSTEGVSLPPSPVPAAELLPSPLREAEEPTRIQIVEGATLYDILLLHYGEFSAPLVARVLQVNPQLNDPATLIVGEWIELPPPTDSSAVEDAEASASSPSYGPP